MREECDCSALHQKTTAGDEDRTIFAATPGANRLGDWSLNLLHTRPKLVVAVSEHDRLGLVLKAAPYATLPQHFADAVFVQLLTIGVPPNAARRERDAMQPLTITATTAATEQKRLYDWWKNIRPNRPDPNVESGWNEFCDRRHATRASEEDDSMIKPSKNALKENSCWTR